jgi:hypothetical protein
LFAFLQQQLTEWWQVDVDANDDVDPTTYRHVDFGGGNLCLSAT